MVLFWAFVLRLFGNFWRNFFGEFLFCDSSAHFVGVILEDFFIYFHFITLEFFRRCFKSGNFGSDSLCYCFFPDVRKQGYSKSIALLLLLGPQAKFTLARGQKLNKNLSSIFQVNIESQGTWPLGLTRK